MPKKGEFKKNAKPRTVKERAYDGSPRRKKDRAARNKARNEAKKKGLVRKGDGKDVGHKRALASGGSRGTKNTKIVSASKNRAEGAKIRERKRKRK